MPKKCSEEIYNALYNNLPIPENAFAAYCNSLGLLKDHEHVITYVPSIVVRSLFKLWKSCKKENTFDESILSNGKYVFDDTLYKWLEIYRKIPSFCNTEKSILMLNTKPVLPGNHNVFCIQGDTKYADWICSTDGGNQGSSLGPSVLQFLQWVGRFMSEDKYTFKAVNRNFIASEDRVDETFVFLQYAHLKATRKYHQNDIKYDLTPHSLAEFCQKISAFARGYEPHPNRIDPTIGMERAIQFFSGIIQSACDAVKDTQILEYYRDEEKHIIEMYYEQWHRSFRESQTFLITNITQEQLNHAWKVFTYFEKEMCRNPSKLSSYRGCWGRQTGEHLHRKYWNDAKKMEPHTNIFAFLKSLDRDNKEALVNWVIKKDMVKKRRQNKQ